MKFRTIIITFILAICFSSITAQNEKKENPLKAKSISIFKNGTAFFIKEGKVKTDEGTYKMTEHLPRALFGTFWIHSTNKELKHVTSYNDLVTTKTEDVPHSFIEMIQANKGKKMKIHIGKDEVYEGIPEEVIIKDVKGDNKSIINPYVVVFKTATQWLTFFPSEIRRVEFLEKPNQLLEKETTVNKNILSVNFTTKKAEQPLEMMYLENGLNWTPTYLIEMTSDTKAKLSLRAEVSNNAEDIINSDVNFVVGIPNFRYANQLSSLVDFLGMIYPNQNQYALNNFSNGLAAQTLDYAEETTLTGGNTGRPMGNGVTGDSDEDLYFYNVKNLNLKKGGRGQYPIFSKNIDIAHIYECNVAKNATTTGFYQKDFLFTPDNQNPVFHSIKVMNNLEFPWTTGSAMVVSQKSGETRPISQDMLNYTPIKGHSYVKLTESPDIKVKHAEKEIDRAQKAKRINHNNYYYDLVTVEGKIKVKSYKDKTVDLNIKRIISGELTESDIKWLKAERVNRSGDINKITDVCWETSIKSGEELEITYTYKVYVPQYY